ncbi:hypothetical protein L1987_48209 [Smallanthus sonchifolius]|uniref:Uncharacterized protein n=1 Tax=Smallanthus sonchifolius TaxID=185202 RepID=A0ACB9FQP9_9ASTR|nr:hypothetical protein L1987_48209 [Smallanthus sonchifolius]
MGESYVGHYVPQLAQLILQNNKITNQAGINLKGIAAGTITEACDDHEGQAKAARSNIFFYDIYAPLCSSSSNSTPSISESDPCTENYIITYLNTPAVQQSLHAKPVQWESCNLAYDSGSNVQRHKCMDLHVADFMHVGGYVVGYQNLTFVTISGAGHFVPSYQPAHGLAFFSSFLEGKLL